MEVMGMRCRIQVYEQGYGRYFALTRISDNDAIISDGESLKEALKRHVQSLPMAISSRRSWLGMPAKGDVAKQ
jgi:hypothetical protein